MAVRHGLVEQGVTWSRRGTAYQRRRLSLGRYALRRWPNPAHVKEEMGDTNWLERGRPCVI